MGNSKEARFKKISSPSGIPNANSYMHLFMTSAPASTSGRTFRSTFNFSRGMVPSQQNDINLRFKKLTPAIRDAIHRTKGQSQEAVEDLITPKFKDYAKFLQPLNLNSLQMWDASKNQFENMIASRVVPRVYTIVKNTPYDSSNATPATNFGDAVDSSFIVTNQPLQFDAPFAPASFTKSDTDHFVKSADQSKPTFRVVSKLSNHLNPDLSFEMHVDYSNCTLGNSTNCRFDVSASPADILRLGDASLVLELGIEQFKDGTYVKTNRTQESEAVITISNDATSGLYRYHMPYYVHDISIVNGSILEQVNRDALQSYKDAGLKVNTKYDASANNLNKKVFANSTFPTTGVQLKLNSAFPTDNTSDWIKSIKISKEADKSNAVDVSNLSIVSNKRDHILFDICKQYLPSAPGQNLWLLTQLKIPSTCKSTKPAHDHVSFHMDFSSNLVRTVDIKVTKVQYMLKGALKPP